MGSAYATLLTSDKPENENAKKAKQNPRNITVHIADYSYELPADFVRNSKTLEAMSLSVRDGHVLTGITLEPSEEPEFEEGFVEEDFSRMFRYMKKNEYYVFNSLGNKTHEQVVKVIQMARYLVVDMVLRACRRHLVEHCNETNIVKHYYTAKEIESKSCEENLYLRFCFNFDVYSRNDYFLQSLNRGLIKDIVHDGRASTSQGEIQIYRAIKRWFELAKTDPFNGQDLFCGVRILHLMHDADAIDEIKKDGLIPHAVFNRMLPDVWDNITAKRSPVAVYDSPDTTDFYKYCHRLGGASRKPGSTFSFYKSMFGHNIEISHTDGAFFVRRKLLFDELTDTSEVVTMTMEITCTSSSTGLIISRTGPKDLQLYFSQSTRLGDAPEDSEYNAYVMVYIPDPNELKKKYYFNVTMPIKDLNGYALGRRCFKNDGSTYLLTEPTRYESSDDDSDAVDEVVRLPGRKNDHTWDTIGSES